MSMETMIKIYLLLKSARGGVFTRLDIGLARALRGNVFGIWWAAPTWLNMIANMENEAALPEAYVDFRLTLAESIREWIGFTFGGSDDRE